MKSSLYTPDPNAGDSSDVSFEALANKEKPLSEAEVSLVFSRVPLIVLADDDKYIRRIAAELIKRTQQDSGSVVRLEGDMVQCFSAARRLRNKLPLILCKNGDEASEATRIICEDNIPSGILALDQNMGGPTGTSIFKGFNGKVPAGFTKILQSGFAPREIDEYIEKGIVDASINKVQIDTIPEMARAYVRKILQIRPSFPTGEYGKNDK